MKHNKTQQLLLDTFWRKKLIIIIIIAIISIIWNKKPLRLIYN